MTEISVRHRVFSARLWVLVLVALVLLGAVVKPYLFPPHELIPWRMDYQAACNEAQAAHKQLFVEFNASWCGACQYLKSTTWSDRSVANALESYIPVSVDADSHHELADQFYVHSLPSFYIVDPKTQNVENGHIGGLSPDDFLNWLANKSDLNRGLGPDDDQTDPLLKDRATAPSTRPGK